VIVIFFWGGGGVGGGRLHGSVSAWLYDYKKPKAFTGI
jgi:hypothetical protein